MTVCLVMIIKDEADVIRRCIDSVRPLIDCWCIVDTGSTDATINRTRNALEDIPGELHERPWVDFATNRNEALELARSMADYSLIMDADDVLVPSAVGTRLPDDFELTDDSYVLDIDFPPIRYRRTQLVKNTIPWRYRGVVHEFLEGPGAQTVGHLPLTIVVGNDGARRRDPGKYAKDAALLEKALETETDPFMVSRYTFYAAQSWRDAGEPEKALRAYLQRTYQGFWADEVYVSWLNVARLHDALGHVDEVIPAYNCASLARPDRVEAYHGAAHCLRMRQLYLEAYQMARRGAGNVAPADGLFVEGWIYQYGLLDELSISAYYAGHYRESVDACEILLSEGKCPDRARIITNANFARRALLGE